MILVEHKCILQKQYSFAYCSSQKNYEHGFFMKRNQKWKIDP